MHKTLITTWILLIQFFSFSQTGDCKAMVHEGTFVSTDEKNRDYRIERTEKSQIEYFNGDKSKVISKVEWISESEYKITVTKEVNLPKEMKNTPKVYHFKIIECDGDYHTLETFYEGQIMSFEMRRLEK